MKDNNLLLCELDPGHACNFNACKSAGKCVGKTCPKDGCSCALPLCVGTSQCRYSYYYDDNGAPKKLPGYDSTDTDKTATLGPATTPIHNKVPGIPGGVKSYQGYGKYAPQCHTGAIKVGELGGMSLWGAREAGVQHHANQANGKPWGLIISLLGKGTLRDAEPGLQMNAAAKAIFPADLIPKAPPMIALEWPDYGVMDMPRAWWLKFAAYLLELDAPVVAYCHGGHGRTGTVLSILAALYEWVPEGECPVFWVRNKYCSEAVESEEQLRYIEAITGRKVQAPPRTYFGGGYKDDWVSNSPKAGQANLPLGQAGSGGSAQGKGNAGIDPSKPGDDDQLKDVKASSLAKITHGEPMSKNKFKRFLKLAKRQGIDWPVEDGVEIQFAGSYWYWDEKSQCLRYDGDI